MGRTSVYMDGVAGRRLQVVYRHPSIPESIVGQELYVDHGLRLPGWVDRELARMNGIDPQSQYVEKARMGLRTEGIPEPKEFERTVRRAYRKQHRGGN